jgi:SET domain
MNLQKGVRLGEYEGKHMTRRSSRFPTHDTFDASVTVTWKDGSTIHHISGSTAPDHMFRFINHSQSPNCILVKDENRIWVETLVDIPKGAELLLYYSDDFQQTMDTMRNKFDGQAIFEEFPWSKAMSHGSTQDNVKLCRISRDALADLNEINIQEALNYAIGVAFPDNKSSMSAKDQKKVHEFQRNNIVQYVDVYVHFICYCSK